MTELAGIAAVLLSLHQAARPLQRLRDAIPTALLPTEPMFQTFEGFDGAGARVCVSATQPDGRGLFWQVEVWIDRHGSDEGGEWSGIVKGEIDLDDDEGDDQCVVNEQRRFTTGLEAAAAIREMSDVVCDYPLEQLLELRWTTDDFHGGDDGSPIGTVWTKTVVTDDTATGVIDLDENGASSR